MYFTEVVQGYLSNLAAGLDPTWKIVYSPKFVEKHPSISYFSIVYSDKNIGIFTIGETVETPTKLTNYGDYGEPPIYSKTTTIYYSFPVFINYIDTDGICVCNSPGISTMLGYEFLPIISYGQNVDEKLEIPELINLFKLNCGLFYQKDNPDYQNQMMKIREIWRMLQEKFPENLAFPSTLTNVSDAFASFMKGEITL